MVAYRQRFVWQSDIGILWNTLCCCGESGVKYCSICSFLLLVINAAECNSDQSLPVCLWNAILRWVAEITASASLFLIHAVKKRGLRARSSQHVSSYSDSFTVTLISSPAFRQWSDEWRWNACRAFPVTIVISGAACLLAWCVLKLPLSWIFKIQFWWI